ncbi:MAG TPA: ABC transporter ATP-binding protein [Rhodanobacteraceae bacterium]|nr:ABC transporter ATP-binding protein [Rhodanobacteraceae bacterium]
MATLELRRIEKHYGGVHAVDGIDLQIADGEFLAILGPSGCGKSTTMRMIAGLEPPTHGDILIGGEVVTHLPPRLRNVSMVFQSYALYPHMSVAENIAFPLRVRHVARAAREQKVAWAAGLMGIEKLLQRRPARLSGGEKQKVALARALVRDPTLFVFDEPLSSLDAKVRAMARSELRLLHDRTGITTVYVTHDQIEALGMGDRIAIMEAGRVRQVGTPQELYAHPADTFVASFLGTPPMNLMEREDHIVGFRPEFVHVATGAGGDDGALRIPAKIFELEFLGADWQVYAHVGDGDDTHRILARMDADEVKQLRVGETAELAVRRDHLRYFDKATGRRIEHVGV